MIQSHPLHHSRTLDSSVDFVATLEPIMSEKCNMSLYDFLTIENIPRYDINITLVEFRLQFVWLVWLVLHEKMVLIFDGLKVT